MLHAIGTPSDFNPQDRNGPREQSYVAKLAGTEWQVVTGANKGIGLEIARELGKRGMTVYVGARDRARGCSR